jgi:hypothetical protein
MTRCLEPSSRDARAVPCAAERAYPMEDHSVCEMAVMVGSEYEVEVDAGG